MAEYIERKAAIEAAEHAYDEWNLAMAAADGKREINLVFKRQELCKAVASVFGGAPAADVAPVVHGRWIYEEETFSTSSGYRCSACRRPRWLSPDVPEAFEYCPKCGAKMDGGAREREERGR